MIRRVAILGLGQRGGAWAKAFHDAGWHITGFDPDPVPSGASVIGRDLRRETTISSSVARVDWVLICLPDRLELLRKVIQRVQAEAGDNAVIAVATSDHDMEAVRNCAMRPGNVIRVDRMPDGGFAADIPHDTSGTVRNDATAVLTELAALAGLTNRDAPADLQDKAESA
jgi:3-hydroxyacyl-CoA dehydrogenase